MHDTWAARDLPVLDATIALLEHSFMVTVTDIAARCELAPAVVAAALEALDPVYVDFRKTTTGGDPRYWYVFKVTPEARRAVGQWPTAESLASRLAEELAAQARHEVDAERQGLLVYAARLVGDTLRDATVRAAGQVLGPAFGGAPVPELGTPVPVPEPEAQDDYVSLVELPELPELLRPRGTGAGAVAEPQSYEPDDFEPDEPDEPDERDEPDEFEAELAPVPEATQLPPLPEPDEPGEPGETDEFETELAPVPEAWHLPPLPGPDEPGEPTRTNPAAPDAQQAAPFRWSAGTDAAVSAPEPDDVTLQ